LRCVSGGAWELLRDGGEGWAVEGWGGESVCGSGWVSELCGGAGGGVSGGVGEAEGGPVSRPSAESFALRNEERTAAAFEATAAKILRHRRRFKMASQARRYKDKTQKNGHPGFVWVAGSDTAWCGLQWAQAGVPVLHVTAGRSGSFPDRCSRLALSIYGGSGLWCLGRGRSSTDRGCRRVGTRCRRRSS